MDAQVSREADAAEVPLMEAQVAPSEGKVMGAPAEDETRGAKVASARGAEVAEVS